MGFGIMSAELEEEGVEEPEPEEEEEDEFFGKSEDEYYGQ